MDIINFTAVSEESLDEASTMEQADLFNWYDDFDNVLSLMPAEAVDAYYKAHRYLVAVALDERDA